MKRVILLLFLLILVICLVGCASLTERNQPIQLYYRIADVTFSENSLVRSENLDQTVEREISAVAKRYFSGPQTETLASPFPKDTALVSHELQDGTLNMEMSEQLAGLSGGDLSLALTCINLTFSQFDGVEAVAVSVPGHRLGGQDSIRLEPDQILLQDNSLEIAEDTINIYFADSDKRYLIATPVKTKLETLTEQASYAVSLLSTVPESNALKRTLPVNTEILDLTVEDGLCIIDFSEDFYRKRPMNEKDERIAILSVVNTLTDFPEINSVQFYVEGASLTTYYMMDLSIPYVKDEMAVGPVRIGLNEFDATLAVIRKNDWSLTNIPVRVKSEANETESDSVLRTLLNFGERNGYISPIPVDTKVLSLTERGNHCFVDLSEDFARGLSTQESEELAVNSIVSSLASLEKIHYVSITIEGKPTGLQYVNLNKIYHAK